MKYNILFFFVLLSTGVFAQIDGPDTQDSGRQIGREKRSVGADDKPDKNQNREIGRSLMGSSKKKQLLGAPDDPKLERKKEDDKVDISKESEFVEKTVDFQPDYLKTMEENNAGDAHTSTQDLGKFHTSGEYVTISWKDSQVVDGDRVDIIVNDEVIVHNVTLLATYKSTTVDLDEGFTKIEFKALNQGESGPNTADFKVEEADGTVLTHDQWNLTTGTKAKLLVVKN